MEKQYHSNQSTPKCQEIDIGRFIIAAHSRHLNLNKWQKETFVESPDLTSSSEQGTMPDVKTPPKNE